MRIVPFLGPPIASLAPANQGSWTRACSAPAPSAPARSRRGGHRRNTCPARRKKTKKKDFIDPICLEPIWCFVFLPFFFFRANGGPLKWLAYFWLRPTSTNHKRAHHFERLSIMCWLVSTGGDAKKVSYFLRLSFCLVVQKEINRKAVPYFNLQPKGGIQHQPYLRR